ncbi:Cytochrome P450 4F22 [Homo sapiens] [Rhizoctonia solani]|uniref:Cytochrome P450 4F22 [Homo sapiens] n=1 Tax=Rhizoctonia solani TaxID=456999 RepID=A0A0K6FXH5_9AGAM|nr:Cytochrome P450 4F22 [Homo sapiens] [Rhizoctonia solani]
MPPTVILVLSLSFLLVSATFPLLASITEVTASMHELVKIILLSRPIAFFIASVFLALITHTVHSLVKAATALRQLDGPPPASLLLGHLQLFFDPVKGIIAQNELLNADGSVCKVKGVLGVRRLIRPFAPILICLMGKRQINCGFQTPVLCMKLLVKSHNHFLQPGSITTWMDALIGPNVLTANGHNHKTQRKILNPAFTATHMRNSFLIGSVTPTIATVCNKLQEIIQLKIQAQGKDAGVLDMFKWLNVTALEMMGQAGFGHSFNASEPNIQGVDYLDASHDIRTLIFKLWYVTPILPGLVRIGSPRFRRAIVGFLPSSSIRALRNAVDVLSDVAVKIYHLKKGEFDKRSPNLDGHLGRDIMSSLLFQNNIIAPEEATQELVHQKIWQIWALYRYNTIHRYKQDIVGRIFRRIVK